MNRSVLNALSADLLIIEDGMSNSSPVWVAWNNLKALIEERVIIGVVSIDINWTIRICGNTEVNQPP